MTSGEFFGILKDIILSGAAITTAYVAYTGLGKWQKELAGKTGFEAAKALTKSTYKLRNELQDCRSPFTRASEFPEEYNKNRGKHTAEESGQAWAHVYKRRWEPVSEALREFDGAVLEAEALWGNPITEGATELRRCVAQLLGAIEDHIENAFSGGEDFKDKEHAKSTKAKIWASSNEKDNELSRSIAQAIEKIEKQLLPHLVRS
mgnify:CR=1 FL=1